MLIGAGAAAETARERVEAQLVRLAQRVMPAAIAFHGGGVVAGGVWCRVAVRKVACSGEDDRQGKGESIEEPHSTLKQFRYSDAW